MYSILGKKHKKNPQNIVLALGISLAKQQQQLAQDMAWLGYSPTKSCLSPTTAPHLKNKKLTPPPPFHRCLSTLCSPTTAPLHPDNIMQCLVVMLTASC